MHITRGVLVGLMATALWGGSSQRLLAAEAAETAPQQAGLDEVVVTARKRDETLISVPVVVTAIDKAELANRGITSLDDVARLVPQLIIGNQAGSVQGGNIALRGISGPDSNPFGEQAVSFNIDGVAIAKGWVRRMTDTDLDQIEVLKGPQALLYGKNSPAGVISIRTADPTDEFEAKTTMGYELEAREYRTEDYVSGPITDTLSARLSGYFSTMQGWLIDNTPANSGYAENHGRNPESKDYALRGTVKWAPAAEFDARLKLNFGSTKNSGPGSTSQFTNCPFGARQTGSGIPCGLNGTSTNSGYGSLISTIPGTINFFRGDGLNFQDQDQILAGLELNYRPSSQYTLTSVTGFYRMQLWQCQNYEQDSSILLPSCNSPTTDRQASEELRVQTNYDGPLNFSAGLYASKTRAETGSLTYLYGGNFDLLGPGLGGPTSPALVDNYYLVQEGESYSGYLQAIYKPIDVVEIDVGGRYSYEEKNIPEVRDGGGLGEGCFTPATLIAVPAATCTTILSSLNDVAINPDRVVFHDFSPEGTISYRPSHDLTIFGSWKHGFLSGGFNSSSVNYALDPDISYLPEVIKGFEFGVKSLLLNRTLAVDAAIYKYNVSNLQVTNFQNATSTIRNAGAVEIRGVEGDVNYKTPIQGLALHAAAAYNDGVYTSFPAAPCYNGQTVALGCSGTFAGGVFNSQNLSGTPLVRAPRWNISGGLNYGMPIGADFKAAFSVDADFSSSYLTDATSAPQSLQPSYTLLDSTLRFGNINDVWAVEFIGRNLTNRYYFVASPNAPFTGGTNAPPLGDRFAALSRGREYLFQVSYRFGKRG
jgi:iron complex outermembrane receptor protein